MDKLILLLAVLVCEKCYSQSFANPSLESWGPEITCAINSPPDQWINYGNAGAGPDEGNLIYCPSTIPAHASNGHTYARMMAGSVLEGEGMYQMVSGFSVGAQYQISFDYVGSNLYGGTGNNQWHLFINDIDMAQSPVFGSLDTTWATYTYTLTATQTTHKIGVRAYTAENGNTGSAGIDNFNIEFVLGMNELESSKSISVFPNPFGDKLTVHSAHGLSEIHIYDLASREIMKENFIS